MACVCALCGFTSDLPPQFQIWPKICSTSPDIYPVPIRGTHSQSRLAWICARCLNRANIKRNEIKLLMEGIEISKHALHRFMERQEGEPISEEAATTAILKIFHHAKSIVFRDRHMISRILNHDGRPADYYFHGGWILVVSQTDPPTILTIERQWHRKLGIDFWFVDEKDTRE